MFLYQKKPIATPGDIAARASVAHHIHRDLGCTAITGNVVYGNLPAFVQFGSDRAHRRFDPMLSRSNPSHVRQRNHEPDGSVPTHPQITHIIEKDHARRASSVYWGTEQRPYNHIGPAWFVDHGGAKGVMFGAKAFQAEGECAGAEVGTACNHQASGFPTGVGIDDANHPSSQTLAYHFRSSPLGLRSAMLSLSCARFKNDFSLDIVSHRCIQYPLRLLSVSVRANHPGAP